MIVGETLVLSCIALVFSMTKAARVRPGRWFGPFLLRYAAGPLASVAFSGLALAWSQAAHVDDKRLDDASLAIAGISVGLGVAVGFSVWWQARRIDARLAARTR